MSALGISLRKYGEWSKAGAVLRLLSSGKILPAYTAQLKDDGELLLERMVGHIDSQDLNWTPLSDMTIRLKNGNDTIYVDTGFLKENLKVRKVRAPSNGVSYFIGADAWTTHPSGLKFSDLMIYLEYGTASIPARPLIRPTFDELEDIIKNHWKQCLKDLLEGGR